MPYSAAADPLCHNGKQIPALYLLGAQSWLPPAEETEVEREARFQRERNFGL